MHAAARTSCVHPLVPGLSQAGWDSVTAAIIVFIGLFFGCPTGFAQKSFARSFVFNNLQSRKGKVPWDKSHRSGKYSYFFLPIGQFRKSYLLYLLDLYYFSCVSHAFCPNLRHIAQFKQHNFSSVHHSSFIITPLIIHSASFQRSSAYPSKG